MKIFLFSLKSYLKLVSNLKARISLERVIKQ